MKRKVIIGLLITFIILVGVYFIYKGMLIKKYESVSNNEPVYLLSNHGTYKVDSNEQLDNIDYLLYENMKFKNVVNDFDLVSGNTVHYEKVVDGERVAYFSYGINDDYVTLLKSGVKYDFYIDMFDISTISKIDVVDYFDRININNCLDLFNYVIRNNDMEFNLFSRVERIKEGIWLNEFLEVIISGDNIDFLEGNYSGYILELGDDTKNIVVLKDCKMYSFMISGLDYYNAIVVDEILSSLVIQ